MKKILLFTLVLCMLVSSVAFAAPSIGYVFSMYEDGNVYYYMFGTADTAATDIGVNIEGRSEDFNLDEAALLKAQDSGKFGIGIADPNNILGNSFKATPYAVVNGEKDTGAEKTVVKSEIPDENVIALNSLTINGKAVAGFYTGTTETDFYYGLDEITSEADIPAVSYSLSFGEATTLLTEETGGYVYTISASATGRDGEEKSTEFKVHFREYSDTVVTVRPVSAYRVSYVDMESSEAMIDLQAQTNGVNMATNTVEDETSDDNTYLYISYYLAPIEGYAPTSYDLTGLRARYNPFKVYSYDGDLSDTVLPSTVEAAENNTMFAQYKGLNYSDAFHLLSVDAIGEGTEYIIDNTGVVASSTSITDGNNILIYKSNYPMTHAQYPAYIYYRGDMENYQMKMVVKYVEKNPKDPSDIDTTLSSLKINGKDADAVKDNTYYVAVSNLETNDGIEKKDIVATPTITGAEAVVSDIVDNQATVTVTAKDGETKETYTVKFKNIETKTMTQSEFRYLYYDTKYRTGTRGCWRAKVIGETMNENWTEVMYAVFSVSDLSNIKMVGDSTLKTTPSRNGTYQFINTNYDTIDATCTYNEILNKEIDTLAELTITNANVNTEQTISIDSSLIQPKENGNIYIGLMNPNKDGTIYATAESNGSATLSINYITLD